MKAVVIIFFLLAGMLPAQTPSSPYEIVLEVLVDGPSTLCFTRNGFYWHNGGNAKPGRHDARNEPTYVNGKPWIPKWRKNNTDRGEDTSDSYNWNTGSIDLTFELVAVSVERGQGGIENRSRLEPKREGTEYHIRIPDPENGARWYKLVVKAPDPLKRR